MFILDLSFFVVDRCNSIVAHYEAIEKRDGSIPFAKTPRPHSYADFRSQASQAWRGIGVC